MIRRIAVLLCALGLFASGCRSGQVNGQAVETSTLQPTGLLTPFQPYTPKPVSPTATVKVTIPVTPSPSATPFLHTLIHDDTLLGIAFQYGVSLEDLEAANPGVDPHYLTVGKQIIIPISGVISDTIPTPTPPAFQLDSTQCYPAGDGGAWCVAAVSNDTQASLENLSAGIGLYTSQGEIIASEEAYAPLNILRPGSTMPLMAYFAPPLPDEFQAHSQVLSGLVVASDDERYLDLQVQVEPEVVSQDGKQAVVHGEVILPEGADALSELWVLAVAYDAQGDIVGARKWQSGGGTQFEIEVYSLAERIDHVELLTEARP